MSIPILLKSSRVLLKRPSPSLIWVFSVLEGIRSSITLDLPPALVITSINDSQHLPNSRHYTDEALDIRSKHFPDNLSKHHFRNALEVRLNDHYRDPQKFRVLFENDGTPNEHFHVQVKKGESFLDDLPAPLTLSQEDLFQLEANDH